MKIHFVIHVTCVLLTIQVSADYVPEVSNEAYLVPTVSEEKIEFCSLTDCCFDASSILDVLKADKGFLHSIQPQQEVHWDKQGFERNRMLVKKLTSCYCALRVRMPSRFPEARKTKTSKPVGLDLDSTHTLLTTGYSLADMINDISRVPLRGCVRRDEAESIVHTRGVEFFNDLITEIERERTLTEQDAVEMIDGILQETRDEIKRESARLNAHRRDPKNNFRARHISLSAGEQIARGMKLVGTSREIVADIASSIRSNPITMGFRASTSNLSNWKGKRENKQYWQIHDFTNEREESYVISSLGNNHSNTTTSFNTRVKTHTHTDIQHFETTRRDIFSDMNPETATLRVVVVNSRSRFRIRDMNALSALRCP